MTSDMIISSRMIHHRITSRGIAYYTLHDSSRDSVPSAVTRNLQKSSGSYYRRTFLHNSGLRWRHQRDSYHHSQSHTVEISLR